jgi:hypothetical protein
VPSGVRVAEHRMKPAVRTPKSPLFKKACDVSNVL